MIVYTAYFNGINCFSAINVTCTSTHKVSSKLYLFSMNSRKIEKQLENDDDDDNETYYNNIDPKVSKTIVSAKTYK